ncbi:hypothetical protein Dimus_036943 [Dionaea muscipula]
MCKLTRENGVWWLGSGENRRRDDEIEVPEEEVKEEVETQNDFDWEVVIDEAADQGESGSGEKFYDTEDEIQEPAAVVEEVPKNGKTSFTQRRKQDYQTVMNKQQAEFERARADRIQADLEKAQAENARLLALLQQAQTKPKPQDFHC